jgi:hypothetical protein
MSAHGQFQLSIDKPLRATRLCGAGGVRHASGKSWIWCIIHHLARTMLGDSMIEVQLHALEPSLDASSLCPAGKPPQRNADIGVWSPRKDARRTAGQRWPPARARARSATMRDTWPPWRRASRLTISSFSVSHYGFRVEGRRTHSTEGSSAAKSSAISGCGSLMFQGGAGCAPHAAGRECRRAPIAPSVGTNNHFRVSA